MIIGILTPYFPDNQTRSSGIANHFFLLAQALNELNHKVVIIHVRPLYNGETGDENTIEDINGITIKTVRISTPFWVKKIAGKRWDLVDLYIKVQSIIQTVFVLKRIAKQYKLQVVETSSYFSLAYLCSYFLPGIPFVVRVSTTFKQMMDEHFKFKSKIMQFIAHLEFLMIKKSKLLITHSLNHAEEIQKLFNIDSNRFTIIPHGINFPKIYSTDTSDNHIIKILYVGRYEYRKGTDTLLEAIPEIINKTTRQIIFQLAGYDPENEYQKEFFKKNSSQNILEKVQFMGVVNNETLALLYHDCDIFVAPSRYESFGLIFAEAMSYGKPVVGCKVGGVVEIIDENINGLFSESGNSHDLAEKIIYLIQNENIRNSMGINGRKKVSDFFTKERLAEKSIAYYRQIVGNE